MRFIFALLLVGCTPGVVPPAPPEPPTAPSVATVTISARDTTLTQVLDVVRRQLPGVTIDVDGKSLPNEVRIPELLLHAEPWPSMIGALARAADLEVEIEASRVRLFRTPRVTCSMKDAPIGKAATLIAAVGRARIEVRSEVTGTVTMSLKNVPWRTALEALVETDGTCALTTDSEGGLYIAPMTEPRPAPVPVRRHRPKTSEGPLVTIRAKDATVASLVGEFRRQVPSMNFEIDASGWPDAFRVKEFTVKDEPWRAAFAAFADLAQAAVQTESPTLLRVSRPGRCSFKFTDAPLRSIIELIDRFFEQSIVLSPHVRGTVSIVANDKPWPQVLEEALAKAGDFVVRRHGSALCIVPGKAAPVVDPSIPEMLEEIGGTEPADRAAVDALLDALKSDSISDRDAAESRLDAAAIVGVGRAWRAAETGEFKSRLERVIRRVWEEP